MKRWSLDRPVAKAERHDGFHEATGLVIRHLVDLEWSHGLLAAIPDEQLEAMSEAEAKELRNALDETDAFEARFLACPLAARVAATDYMADLDMAGYDYEENVTYWRLLAKRAEVEDRKAQGPPLQPATPEEPPSP
jgi:hypothetical protein